MKIYIPEPPRNGKDTAERLDYLTGWLYDLTQKLNLGFQHIGEENLCDDLRKRLEDK